jgi:plastocyanin
MHGRVVGAAITLVVLLAVPAVASAATKTVQAGPPGSQAGQFQRAFGDANDFFRKVTTIHKGDSVKWKINGFHNVLFPQGGVQVPALIVPDSSSLVTGVLDAANLPFWFNGQPNLAINPLVAAPKGGKTYKPGKLFNSGLPPEDGPPSPYKLKFKKTGSFSYFCAVHPGMGGTIKVVKKSKAIPSGKADKKARNKEIAAKLAQVNRLTTGANLSLTDTIQAGNDRRSGATIYKFFPAVSNIKAGTTLTLQMPPSTTEVHTFTFGPINGKDGYVDQLAANLIGPVIDPRGAYPSDLPSAGTPVYTGANHGNGFLNTGFLAGGGAVQLPTSRKVTFTTPGTYSFICLIHPFMTGRVTVTP